jgi:hypothetical protein
MEPSIVTQLPTPEVESQVQPLYDAVPRTPSSIALNMIFSLISLLLTSKIGMTWKQALALSRFV